MTRKDSPRIIESGESSIERIPTGIPGLDPLLEGGFVKGSTVLVTGGTGTGKTTFCVQYILEGAKKGEAGVYVTFEEAPEDIKKYNRRYGFDFSPYEKSGKLVFIYQNPFDVSDIPSVISNALRATNAKRLVLDPLSIMGLYMKDPAVLRKRLFEIIRLLKKTNATTLITSEIPDNEIGDRGGGSLSRDGVAEFVVDGVIVLNLFGIGEGITRSVLIRKMRGTKHATDVVPMEITNKGIVVNRPQ